MCGLFGMVNYVQQLGAKDINEICNALARESEERGSHATGISYVSKGKIIINKAPKPAHKLNFKAPDKTITIMGHTRHSTQGSEKKNFNNHPFAGYTRDKKSFALAHNGVLWNDRQLRQKHNLPKTKIETDSYIAVQLIEQKDALNFDSLKYMGEQVNGSFTFSLLDNSNNIYIVKGDSPISMLHFVDLGIYVYASTDEILYKAISETMLLRHLKSAMKQDEYVDTIDISDGSIIKIDNTGNLTSSTFDYDEYGSFGYSWWNADRRLGSRDEDEYLEMLRLMASELGYDVEDVDRLYESGFSLMEIEELLYDPNLLYEYYGIESEDNDLGVIL